MAGLGKEAVARRGKVECAIALSSLREGGEGTVPAAERQQTPQHQHQQQQQQQQQHQQQEQQEQQERLKQEQQQQEHLEQIQVPVSGVDMSSTANLAIGMPPTTTAGGPIDGGEWDGDLEDWGFPGQVMLDVSDPSNPLNFFDLIHADGGAMGFDNGGSGSGGAGLGASLGMGMNMGFGPFGVGGVFRDQCLA